MIDDDHVLIYDDRPWRSHMMIISVRYHLWSYMMITSGGHLRGAPCVSVYIYIYIYIYRSEEIQFQMSASFSWNLQICIRTHSMRWIGLYSHIRRKSLFFTIWGGSGFCHILPIFLPCGGPLIWSLFMAAGCLWWASPWCKACRSEDTLFSFLYEPKTGETEGKHFTGRLIAITYDDSFDNHMWWLSLIIIGVDDRWWSCIDIWWLHLIITCDDYLWSS